MELLFCLSFCMGVKLGLTYYARNLMCLRTGRWGEYLELREKATV
jgi:hypothetical protein